MLLSSPCCRKSLSSFLPAFEYRNHNNMYNRLCSNRITFCIRNNGNKKKTLLFSTSNSDSFIEESLKHRNVIEKLQLLQNEIYSFAGYSINLNSPQQVSSILFDGDKSRATNKSILLNMVREKGSKAIVVKKILEWRSLKNTQRKFSTSKYVSEENSIQKNESMNITTREVTDPLPSNADTCLIELLFKAQKNEIASYWRKELLRINKPSANALLSQLSPYCPLGYDPLASPFSTEHEALPDTKTKKNSLLNFVREQKRKHPNFIILTRVGEFYETYGIDSICLVEYCGLNPMGGKAKAGCPVRNIQSTLDDLTHAGLRVAVYEELSHDTDHRYTTTSTTRKNKLKTRFLAQTVTSAQPNYLYGFRLSDCSSTVVQNNEYHWTREHQPSRLHMGIIHTAKDGYTLVEISIQERTVRVTERLTQEAILCRLEAFPPANPLFYVSTNRQQSPLLTSRSFPWLTIKLLPFTEINNYDNCVKESEKVMSIILNAVLDSGEGILHDPLKDSSSDAITTLKSNDFKLLPSYSFSSFTQPLHSETARQLGLLNNPSIPCLITSLVDENTTPSCCKRFLRKWLLVPPPLSTCKSMSNIVLELRSARNIFPLFSLLNIGQVLSLLRSSQANASTFREIISSLDFFIHVLENSNFFSKETLIKDLLNILEFEAGIPSYSKKTLLEDCKQTKQLIQKFIITSKIQIDPISNFDNRVLPKSFLERNELPWRNKVQPDTIQQSQANVRVCAKKLEVAILEDFYHGSNKLTETTPSIIVQDIFDNKLSIKQLPSGEESSTRYYHPRDRKGKLLRNRYSTKEVERTLSDYIEACEEACERVSNVLLLLNQKICYDDSVLGERKSHLPILIQAAHVNLILCTAYHHAMKSVALGWNLSKIQNKNQIDTPSSYLKNVWPYWMSKSESVGNTFTLKHLFCLTAPNSSGKSTLMRSTAAAALLAICGLASPLEKDSIIQRFDTLFVRGTSVDIPTENKSAFGAEMTDVISLMKNCGKKFFSFCR